MKLIRTGSRILLSRLSQVFANALVVMVVAKSLGPEGQGHYSLTIALALLLSALMGGGMGLAAVPPLRQDKVPIRRMLKAQLLWASVMVAVLFGLGWLSTGAAAADLFSARLGWFAGVGFIVALAATGLLGFDIFSYDLLARGRLVIGSAVNGWRAFGHLVLIALVAAVSGMTLGRAVGAFAVAQFAGGAVMLLLILREIKSPRRTLRVMAPDDPVAIADTDIPADLGQRSLLGLIAYNLRRGWLGQISAVAYFLLLRLDQGLLEYFCGAAEVGIYSVGVYVGEMLWLLPGALTPLLVHSSAATGASGERDATAVRALRLGLGVTLAAAIPLYLLAGPLLELLAGGQFAGSGPALRALLPGIVAFAPGAVLAGDFIGRGKPHWNTQASGLTVVVNVVFGLILIPDGGAVGAAWASSIAYAAGASVMLLRFHQVTGLWIFSRSR